MRRLETFWLAMMIAALTTFGMVGCGDDSGGTTPSDAGDADGTDATGGADGGVTGGTTTGGTTTGGTTTGGTTTGGTPTGGTPTGGTPTGGTPTGGMTGGNACDMDTTAPTITAQPTAPVVVAFDQTTASFDLTFSEAVTGVAATSFTVDNGATVESVMENGTTYTVNLGSLAAGTTYTVTFDETNVADLCMNALDAGTTVTVVVADAACAMDMTAPTLTIAPPSPVVLPMGTVDFDLTLNFSEDVTGVSAAAVSADNGATITEVTEVDASTYTARIGTLMPGDTTVTVGTIIVDGCGNALEAPVTATITIATMPDMTPPTVVSSVPADMDTGVVESTTIQVNFDEVMDTASTGTVTVDVGGTAVMFTAAWINSGSTLEITPDAPFNFDDVVTFTVDGVTDLSANALAAPFSATFTVRADPCAGLPAMVTINNAPQAVPLVNMNEAVVTVAYDAPFTLAEADITVMAQGAAMGTLTMGSLTNVDPQTWQFTIGGVAANDQYTVSIAGSTTPDGCTTFAMDSINVLVSSVPTMTGMCPLPPALGTNTMAPDACDATPTNDTVGTAAATGATLTNAGDAFSVTGILDADGSADWYAFDLVETGNVSDLGVTIAYGCNFTGTGAAMLPASTPSLEITDAMGTPLGAATSAPTYDMVNGSGSYGFGNGIVPVFGPAGTNTYLVRLDAGAGMDWCMDYGVYVELVDNTLPGACFGLPPVSNVNTMPQVGQLSAGTLTVGINLDAPFPLMPGDVTVTATSGGAGMAGMLTQVDPSTYTLDITGAADGDTYDVVVAMATDPQCGTALSGGTIPVTAQAVDCTGAPMAATVTSMGGNFISSMGVVGVTVTLDAPAYLTPADITVMGQAGAMGTIVPGSLSQPGVITDTYTFDIQSTMPGETYDVTVASLTDACGTMITGGTFSVSVAGGIPTMTGMCPIPVLANNTVDVDGCDQNTHNDEVTAQPSGAVLAAPGDAFSVSGILDSDVISGSDEDWWTFDVVENGTTITDLQVSFAYGCNYTGGGTLTTFSEPEVEVFEAPATGFGDIIGTAVGDTAHGNVAAGSYGGGSVSVAAAGAAGTNTYWLALDDVSGSNWCMDYAIYVELVDNTRPVACLGAPVETTVDVTPQDAGTIPAQGTATVDILLDFDFQLMETDLSLTATTGTGMITPMSLTQVGPGAWTVELSGVAPMDSYTLDIAGRQGQCNPILAASIPVNIVDLTCLGAGMGASLTSASSAIIADPMAPVATFAVTFDAPFQLAETDVAIVGQAGATGMLAPGSLMPGGGITSDNFTLGIAGAVAGDVYDVTVTGRTDSCGTTMVGGTFQVSFVGGIPNMPSTCPIPVAATNFTAPDACNATPTNSSIGNSFPTGVLNAPGDAFSISGTYDSDGADLDFFSFQVNETGTTIAEVSVGFAYGCNFTNGGTPGGVGGDIELYAGTASATNPIVDFGGTPTFATVNGSGSYGYGSALAQLGGPMGLNTYSLRVDDISGFTWCMDFVLYLEYVDNTLPLACLGVPAITAPNGAPQDAPLMAGSAAVSVSFPNDVALQPGDIIVTPTSGGSGTLAPGSLTAVVANTEWTFDLAGVNSGETYDISFMAGTDQCTSIDTMAIVPVTVRDPACVGAVATSTLNTTSGFGQIGMGGTAVVSLSFSDPYLLTEAEIMVAATGGGMGAIQPGSLVGSNGPGVTSTDYTFVLQGVAIGESYDVSLMNATDTCGTALTGGTSSFTITSIPTAQGMCPIPAFTTSFMAPDACGQQTNNTLATAVPTGTLMAAGDAFSITGIYDSGGSDNDFFTFDIVEDGASDYTLVIGITYGCNFTGTGTPGGAAPDVDLRDSGGSLLLDTDGNQNYNVVDGSGSFGQGIGNVVIPSSTPGPNTYSLRLDDVSGLNWCMDYAIYVELSAITAPPPVGNPIMDNDGTIIESFGGMAVPFTDAANMRTLPYAVTYGNNEPWPPTMASTSYREIRIPGATSVTVEGTYDTETNFDDFVVGDGMFMEFFRADNSNPTPFSVTVPGDTVVLAVDSDGSVQGAGYTINQVFFTP